MPMTVNKWIYKAPFTLRSIYTCKIVVDSIPCRGSDTAHMLDIIDELNIEGVQDQDLLVSFDITNMFPSIDNQTGLERIRRKLNE